MSSSLGNDEIMTVIQLNTGFGEIFPQAHGDYFANFTPKPAARLQSGTFRASFGTASGVRVFLCCQMRF
jgi:hypothetical protein